MGTLNRVRCRGFAVSCSNLREEDAAFLTSIRGAAWYGTKRTRVVPFPVKTDPAAVEAATAAQEL
jgi:hypothetical protein